MTCSVRSVPEERSFPWASVTKPATALAVLVAVEEGSLSLDEPAGPPGSTVRHLLAHASGLGPEPGPPLAAPGIDPDLFERRLPGCWPTWWRSGRASPSPTTCARVCSIRWAWSDTGLDPAVAAGRGRRRAWPARSPTCSSLGRELAAPTLISAETHRAATSVQFAGLAGVLPGFGRFDPCDWGLGVEIRGDKHAALDRAANSPRTFGHFGRSGSFLWVDPEAGVLCAGLSDRPFGPWAARSWPALADAVLAEWAAVGAPGQGDRRRPVARRRIGSVRLRRMKGVILAGGTGSRLHPLTRITNKHLLPIYDRPMINWGIEALVNAGITEIMLVTGGTHAGEFLRLLGNGHEFGIDRLSYGYQEQPGGIAEALGLAARFVDGEPVLVMLADNIVERSIKPMVDAFTGRTQRGPHPPHAGRGGRAPPPPRRARVRRRRSGWSASSRSRTSRSRSSA